MSTSRVHMKREYQRESMREHIDGGSVIYGLLSVSFADSESLILSLDFPNTYGIIRACSGYEVAIFAESDIIHIISMVRKSLDQFA